MPAHYKGAYLFLSLYSVFTVQRLSAASTTSGGYMTRKLGWLGAAWRWRLGICSPTCVLVQLACPHFVSTLLQALPTTLEWRQVVTARPSLPPQVFFTTSIEYIKVSDDAADLGALGVAGLGVDPLEDCPACSQADREPLPVGG